MARFKVTWFFESQQQADVGAGASLGWTETWYLEGTYSLTDLADGEVSKSASGVTGLGAARGPIDIIDLYAVSRSTLLTEDYRCSFARVTDIDAPRAVKIRNVDRRGGWTPTAVPGGVTSGIGFGGQVQCAALVDYHCPSQGGTDRTHHRRFLIRAIPKELINGNVINTASPAYKRLLFMAASFGAGHQTGLPAIPNQIVLPLKVRVPSTANTPIPLTTIRVSSDLRYIDVRPQLSVPINSFVEVRHAPDSYRFVNRNWRFINNFTDPDLGTMSRLGKSRKNMPITSTLADPAGVATALIFTPVLIQPIEYVIIGLRSKKTGSVFRRLRGRSPTR